MRFLIVVIILLNYMFTWAAIVISGLMLTVGHIPADQDGKWSIFFSYTGLMLPIQIGAALVLFILLKRLEARSIWYILVLSTPFLLFGWYSYEVYSLIF
ncbi:hypothetical protein A33I_18650 [Alkalihalophilus marmarensis DSM 21297]|uniref:Uncharacterized protein n=1 Tax=Alkalihalophilus marmarensis DSM 21297 TaxID=1188261 RepID=U6SKF3_9BACI|nr:hypothetical protein A33I_18650 [Alkalihalophilus marmarensis DSM 21297]